ncbi:insulinase family protein [Allopseudospirillum japonicum]|nr:insulinase family protein [Allopseudospirillum japonicum]
MSKLQAATIHKPLNDARTYHAFTLENGLQVLAITDPEAEKAAVAMHIGAGSHHEPKAYPRLAHFLEHMLFLGTRTYPQADAYAAYINQHGGQHNAMTAHEYTQYFFDVNHKDLEGALARFAPFFSEPLLDPQYVQREVKAVDSEYSAKLQQDGRRILGALRQAFHPDHPLAHFSAGNAQTLPVDDPQLVPALREFFETYYRAPNMRLVVMGSQSVEQLTTWVRTYFAQIGANLDKKEESKPSDSLALWSDQHPLPLRLEVQTLKDERTLKLYFPVPHPKTLYPLRPVQFLANFLGHEGEGSLHAHLDALGWITQLGAGLDLPSGEQAFFALTLGLTPEGAQHQTDILQKIFSYIQLVRTQGMAEWRYQEMALLAQQSFDFQEPLSGIHYVSRLANNLYLYPVEDALQASYRFGTFDVDAIQPYLEALRPQNLLLLYAAPPQDFTEQTQYPWQKSPWYPTLYRLAPQTIQTLADITDASTLGLQLPEANPYIADALPILARASQEPMHTLLDTPEIKLWHSLSTLQTPKANLFIYLKSPVSQRSLREHMLTALWINAASDAINTQAYPASLAGLTAHLYQASEGVTLRTLGYAPKQIEFALDLLEQVQTLQITPERFAQLQAEMQRALSNMQHKPLTSQMFHALSSALFDPAWSVQEQAQALAQLTLADLQNFQTEFFTHLQLEILSYGNLTTTEAQHLAEQLKSKLHLDASQVSTPRRARLLPTQTKTYLWKPEIQHNDHAQLLYLQAQQTDVQTQAQFALLAQMQRADFFHQLRTEQQLGYVVFTQEVSLLDRAGLVYVVQSPHIQPDALAQQIQNFLQAYQTQMANLTDDALMRFKEGVIASLRQPYPRLSSRAATRWMDIRLGYIEQARKEAIADAVDQISLTQMHDFYQQLLTYPKLWLQVTGESATTVENAANPEIAHPTLSAQVVDLQQIRTWASYSPVLP